jgi:hypothetical protein
VATLKACLTQGILGSVPTPIDLRASATNEMVTYCGVMSGNPFGHFEGASPCAGALHEVGTPDCYHGIGAPPCGVEREPHQALWRGIIMRWRNSRNRHSTLLVVGTCLGVYVVLAVCIHWLTQPAVVTAYGAAPVATVADTRIVTPAPPEQPSPVPSEPSTSARAKPPTPATVTVAAVAPETVENPAAAPKKAAKNRVARTAPRRERSVRERRNPMWDYASGSYNGNRPWY